MLYLILSLSWFKYCLEAFSDQVGKPVTIPVKKYDNLCATIGQQLARQSNHDVPRTTCPKGFSSGAYPAMAGKEFTSCQFLVKFAFPTTQFSCIFPKRKQEEDPQLKYSGIPTT